jgi:glycosyltransferase involved in cell wall biosynthesis
MKEFFPNHPFRYNLIYSVSGSVPVFICQAAKKRGVRILQHINSLHHPAYRPNYEELNKPIQQTYGLADFIVFGSNFAEQGARRYLGDPDVPFTHLYNSVDVEHFRPLPKPSDRFNVLAIGFHHFRHRIEPLIRAMPTVIRSFPQAKLLIAGQLHAGEGIWDTSRPSLDRVADEVGLSQIEFLPRYTQREAPGIYAQGDLLVHLKHMDWTPNTVAEGMACGLPILHTGNGGVPEIVGEAGLSLSLPYDWDHIHTPDPDTLAEKIVELYEIRRTKGALARQAAEDRFDLDDWISEHRVIFSTLLSP